MLFMSHFVGVNTEFTVNVCDCVCYEVCVSYLSGTCVFEVQFEKN